MLITRHSELGAPQAWSGVPGLMAIAGHAAPAREIRRRSPGCRLARTGCSSMHRSWRFRALSPRTLKHPVESCWVVVDPSGHLERVTQRSNPGWSADASQRRTGRPFSTCALCKGALVNTATSLRWSTELRSHGPADGLRCPPTAGAGRQGSCTTVTVPPLPSGELRRQPSFGSRQARPVLARCQTIAPGLALSTVVQGPSTH